MQDTEEFDVSNAEWILIIEKEAVFRRLTGSIFHIQLPKPPRIYILVDSDPDGMAIMSTYKYGSMAHAGENARLNIPCIRWLGLRTSDVVADADPLGDDALGSLTPRDRKKAISMLSNNPVWADDGPELGWRAELQVMLMLNLKAEIETLYNREGGIERWIDQQVARL
ncbi:hypothetical protein HFD88_006985 [Aspergillus terreus]|nr:hypothetical protein HFD88_006985 [Aspergillus terreus]